MGTYSKQHGEPCARSCGHGCKAFILYLSKSIEALLLYAYDLMPNVSQRQSSFTNFWRDLHLVALSGICLARRKLRDRFEWCMLIFRIKHCWFQIHQNEPGHIQLLKKRQIFNITSARVSDSGSYYCTATNIEGTTEKVWNAQFQSTRFSFSTTLSSLAIWAGCICKAVHWRWWWRQHFQRSIGKWLFSVM